MPGPHPAPRDPSASAPASNNPFTRRPPIILVASQPRSAGLRYTEPVGRASRAREGVAAAAKSCSSQVMSDNADMDRDAAEKAKAAAESRLNNIVATLVALVATFVALCNVKDGN